MKLSIRPFVPALFAAGLLLAESASAQSVSSTTTFQSAFVTDGTYQGNGQANYNFGGAGTLALAGANSGNGTLESLLEFNISAAQSTFDAEFGVGNWSITSVTLSLASNFAQQGQAPNNAIFSDINGGGFGLAWIPDNSWTAGTGSPGSDTTSGVTYNTLGPVVSGSENVGTFTYTPPGNTTPATYETYTLSPTSDLQSEITTGTDLSLVAYATDGTIYLFNAPKFNNGSNEPILTITAVPEPAAWGSILIGLTGLTLLRRRLRA